MDKIITIRFSGKKVRDRFLRDVLENITPYKRSEIVKEILYKVFLKLINEQSIEATEKFGLSTQEEKQSRKEKSLEDFIF